MAEQTVIFCHPKEMKANRTVNWVIPNFTPKFAASSAVMDRFESLPFALMFDDNKTIWSLKCFPNSNSAETSGNVGIFLTLESATMKNFTAKYKFGIVSKTGEISNIAEREREANEFKSSSGFSKFISHGALFDLTKYWLPRNRLTVMCELSIYIETAPEDITMNDTSMRLSSAVTPRDAGPLADYKRMFENGALCDFELRMNDDQTLKAHKAILSARSPVFFTMLTSGMQEATESSVHVPDFDSVTMKELLRFVYCNETRNMSEVVFDLTFAAEKYEISQLKQVCSNYMKSKITTENIIDIMIIADRVSDMRELFDKCVEFIVQNYPAMSKDAIWKKIPNDFLHKILDTVMKTRRKEVIHV